MWPNNNPCQSQCTKWAGLVQRREITTGWNLRVTFKPIESEVLALGLNFVATPSASTRHLIQKSATRVTWIVKKLFYFEDHSLTIKHPWYWKPPTWIPPELNLAKLSLFMEQIQGPSHNHSRHTTRPNLISQQRSALQKLDSNADLVFKPFDKGSGICLMDTSLYINKIEEHLANSTTYKKLNSDPTQAIRNDVLSTLDYLHITHRIDDQTRHHLIPTKSCTYSTLL